MNEKDKNLTWTPVSVEHLVKDQWIDFRKVRYRFPNGEEFEPYYQYSRRDYVVIVARDCDGRYLCVRQFRHGIGKVTVEFSAGGIEREGGTEYGGPESNTAKESALEAAKRELQEETGYVSSDWKLLLAIPSNPTIADNYAYVFQADHCRKTADLDLDDTEFLEPELYTEEEIQSLVEEGSFAQPVHVMAWLMARK
ncbi:MAG: NUDIX hydrolase [Eubacteriales bacterium]|nr:NUDIX hydrolase [Eubacteriales bacterium]